MEANRIQILPRGMFWKNVVLLVIGLILFIGVIAYAVHETTKATVTIFVDGEETTVQTHAKTVAELMDEQEWDVKDYDRIEPSMDTAITGNMTINWDVAKRVYVTIDGQKKPVWTTAENVRQLIQELNIDFQDHDSIEPNLNQLISSNMDIVYEAAFPVQVFSDGEQQEIWTTSTTVADFLEKEKISLNELDRVEPALDEKVEKETDIKVVRVEKVTDVVEEAVPFGTVTRKDKSLDSGKESVVQKGEKGLVNKYYEVILEDGKEVSRELVKTETLKESIDKIVAVGTRPQATSVSRSKSSGANGNQAAPSGGRTLTVTATAYTAGCRGCSGITSTGINLKNNRNMKVIAVDPNVIPLGSRVYVEGYGTAIAGDTGGAINGNKIDVHVPTEADAKRWGRKKVTIKILD